MDSTVVEALTRGFTEIVDQFLGQGGHPNASMDAHTARSVGNDAARDVVARVLDAATNGEQWSTRAVATFLGVSRQALNKRVQQKSMLGVKGKGTTWFPVWQFDVGSRCVRAEVAPLLAALGGRVDAATAARWAATVSPELGDSPAHLVATAQDTAAVLDLARRFGRTTQPRRPAVPGPPKPDAGEPGPLPGEVLRKAAAGPREALLAAAAELFARHGPAKVSLRRIAAHAGVPYGLIYRFYGTKNNLLVSVMHLFISHGSRYIVTRPDLRTALENSFDGDEGMFTRMLTWAILDGVEPARIFPAGSRSAGYRTQLERLWAAPVAPAVRDEFDPRVIASLIQVVSMGWDLYAPYLVTLADAGDRDAAGMRAEVIEALQVLAYAARPRQAGKP